MIYVIVDTNVIISGLLSKKNDTATSIILSYIMEGTITPLYSNETINELSEVMKRPKINIIQKDRQTVIKAIKKFGVYSNPHKTNISLIDKDDIAFYEIAIHEKEKNPFLITGNIKHYPNESFVVTPREFLHLINN